MSGDAKSTGNQLVELVVVVAVALGMALGIQAFIVKPYRIPSESMVPTLAIGQRVLVNRVGKHFGDPHVGQVTVFHPPAGAENDTCGTQQLEGQACAKPTSDRSDTNYIKRIVAGPGDTILIREGRVVRNGKPQVEDFIAPCAVPRDPACNFRTPLKVPAGHYFMMGDNRGASDDSRFWGPVPEKWIIGNAFGTYWPPRKIGVL